jgi:Undecaprenyl-phosphate glucose phosphotransferase
VIAHFRRYKLLFRIMIYVLPLVSFLLAGYFHAQWIRGPATFHSPEQLYLALFTTMAWSIVAEMEEVTKITKVSARRRGIRGCLAACGITYLVDLIALFIVHDIGYSRAIILLSALILMALAVFMHTVFRIILREFAGRAHKIRVMIIGASRFAARAAIRVQRNEFLPCHIVGYIQLPGEEIHVSNAPVLRLSEMEAIENLNPDDILIAVPPDRFGDIRRCIAKLRALGKPFRIILTAGSGIKIRDRIVQVGELQMLDLDPSPAWSVAYFLVKRGFDLVFASAVLIAAAIPMLAIGAIIKLTSPGPLLFRQRRVGRNGRLFTMYKFRTMRFGPEIEGETHWTTEIDPRRTPFGALLRKTSLDELPQFLNVLKGEMSVVGPRPERPLFVKKFRRDISLYQERHHLNVGITGWAQVNGFRGDTSIQRRVRYDLYYLQHWSLLFDIRIILMTVFGGFMGKNAY